MGRLTFQKRQKEMKRREKQMAKAERRAQKKLANRAEGEIQLDEFGNPIEEIEGEILIAANDGTLSADGSPDETGALPIVIAQESKP